LQTRGCGSISCCVVEQWLGVRRTPSHCSTTHSHTTWYAATTPHFQIRIQLWILYYNFSKEQSSLMVIWQDPNMSETFKVFYVKLYVQSLVDKLKWFYKNARCYNKIYTTNYRLKRTGDFSKHILNLNSSIHHFQQKWSNQNMATISRQHDNIVGANQIIMASKHSFVTFKINHTFRFSQKMVGNRTFL